MANATIAVKSERRTPFGLLLVCVAVALLVLAPLAFTLKQATSFSFDDAVELLFRPIVGELAVNTLLIVVAATFASALIGTAVAFGLILWLDTGNVAAKFQNVLLFTAYWIAPFLAVVLIDWRDRRDGVNRETLVHMLEWKNLRSGWPALLSLLVGFGAMVPFMDTGLVHGAVSNQLDGADLSFVVGFVVAGVLYYPLRKLAAHPAQPMGPGTTSLVEASTSTGPATQPVDPGGSPVPLVS